MFPQVHQDDNEAIPVADWMMSHTFFKDVQKHCYPLHTGAVGIPGLTKGSRIVSLKVPPLFHPEYDVGTEYGLSLIHI